MLQSIGDVTVKCDCGWEGIVAQMEPDIDGDGGLGCPVCQKVIPVIGPPGNDKGGMMADLILTCECGCEIVRVTVIDWEDGEPWQECEMGWYILGGWYRTLGQRIGRAWDVLCGRDVCNASIVLSRSEAYRLARWLDEQEQSRKEAERAK